MSDRSDDYTDAELAAFRASIAESWAMVARAIRGDVTDEPGGAGRDDAGASR